MALVNIVCIDFLCCRNHCNTLDLYKYYYLDLLLCQPQITKHYGDEIIWYYTIDWYNTASTLMVSSPTYLDISNSENQSSKICKLLLQEMIRGKSHMRETYK